MISAALIRDVARSAAEAVGLGDTYRSIRDRRWRTRPTALNNGLRICAPATMLDYKRSELVAFEAELSSVDVCVDVGANVGFYSCIAANMKKHVIAVEPLPDNLAVLYANLHRNNMENVEVFPLALGAKSGLAPIYGRAQVASLLPTWSRVARSNSEMVSVSTLDILLGERFKGLRLLIKVDVEGFEREVLAGGSATLQREPRPIWLVEAVLKNPMTGQLSNTFSDIFQMFWRGGYAASCCDGTPVDENTVAEWVRRGSASSVNFIFRSR